MNYAHLVCEDEWGKTCLKYTAFIFLFAIMKTALRYITVIIMFFGIGAGKENTRLPIPIE